MHARLLPGLLLVVATLAARAGEADPGPAPGADRRAIDQHYEQSRQACSDRFASNACLDEARQRRRQALAALQAQQQALDTQHRQQRAAQRQQEIERRQQRVDRPVLAAKPAAASDAASHTPVPPQPDQAARVARQRQVAARAQAKASERAAAARKLRAGIQADQARIQARLAKRKVDGKAAQPLPPPAVAGSAPT